MLVDADGFTNALPGRKTLSIKSNYSDDNLRTTGSLTLRS